MGQIVAIMSLTIHGVYNPAKVSTSTTLSCQGLLAQVLKLSNLPFKPTGTQTNRPASRIALDAIPVLIGLIGCPSVMTITTELASCLPLISSALASTIAMEVRVVVFAHVIPETLALASVISVVKRCTQCIPHWF